ncbi:MAG TPA: flavin reductase family protein [Solirubrobacteraceae bacterium]|jgi:3-hydroxy-9,10-secoandrosta-1,3,5(10)-triene-9,17-dione monooxygenase reductase component|nr:flavin reductase family protein [Solirubrobacteraceae bacterium]
MNRPLAAEAIDPLELRRAASRFATGVALVTAPGGAALVIDSFISASLDPPLVAFTPSRASLTWRRMRATGRFAVNVLGARHAAGLRERARPGADRLAGLDVELTTDAVPVLRDALAVLLCTFEREHAAGDHTLVLGRVHAVRHGPSEPPLVFFDGALWGRPGGPSSSLH